MRGMKPILTYLLFAVIGIGIGGYSALSMAGLLPDNQRMGGSVEVDGWFGNLDTGSEDASPYFRARLARTGLLALANSEAIYFSRAFDDSGQPFTENCTYRISGGQMPARWWSVTLYNADNFLPDNTDGALSYDATKAGNGRWQAIIAPQIPSGGADWISSKAGGDFDLTFRLYVPDEGVVDQPTKYITAPSVERLDCAGERP